MHKNREKKAWKKPQLEYVGDIGNIVQGWGKTVSYMDADPHSPTAKSGGG